MKGRRILIVEDETIVRLHLQRILTDLGCVVTGMAGTAAEALDSCAQDPPDLVLMDIRLPGDRDGIDLGGELRARYGVAVVFVTAYADRETVGRSQEVGAVGYIVKPFNKAEVEPSSPRPSRSTFGFEAIRPGSVRWPRCSAAWAMRSSSPTPRAGSPFSTHRPQR